MIDSMRTDLLQKVHKLPDRPGVYLFRDAAGGVLYVGKALSLRNRVRSYFQTGQPAKISAMLEKAADLSFIVTANEVEALVLEANLIKRHRPRYNVVLKDDKTYPYIKVTVQEEFPRVLFSRRRAGDGARYFGPYTRAGAVYETLRFLRTVFPYRSCKSTVPGRSRPCLNYHIKRCPGPCTGAADPEAYRQGIEALCLFLEGRYRAVMRQLEEQMAAAAADLKFERAAVLRDRLRALQTVLARQRVVSGRSEDQDVVALGRAGEEATAAVLMIREGRLIGQERFPLTGAAGQEDAAVLAGFLMQYYGGVAASVPREVVMPVELGDEGAVLRAYLQERAGRRVVLTVPRRGRKRELLNLAAANAAAALEETGADAAVKGEALAALGDLLGLGAPPRRIEGYDASCLQGTTPVAVMVVFKEGKPLKSGYRRFAVNPAGKPDDYAALREALRRRFARAREEEQAVAAGVLTARAAKFLPLPDVVLVDGGAGQAAVAGGVLAEFGYEGIPVIGLAKENEWLYRPGRAEPVVLPRDDRTLRLLQRVRDEAHRFAVSFHRKRRAAGLKSVLEEIEGIGPVRRRALLQAFLSLETLQQAGLEELRRVPGMNRRAAEAVYQYFREQKLKGEGIG
ncbi:MAG: excinuclease ABC subunit UvrC [Bacillota bacterium]|nr:excinuclease ABC subunit UvrC [Thermoanaerobacteraceae bacterium]